MKEQLQQLKDYSFFRVIRLGFSYLRTKIFYRPAMFIFFPIDIRGKSHIQLGKQMTCGTGCRFEVYADRSAGKVLVIGDNVQINDYVHIAAIHSVKIGDNVLMASRIYIYRMCCMATTTAVPRKRTALRKVSPSAGLYPIRTSLSKITSGSEKVSAYSQALP